MLKDITIGQYFPGASVLHKLDPRVKIVLTIAYIVMLFAASNAVGLAVGVLFLIVVYAVSKIPPSMILKSLKPVVPIIIFTSLLNMLFIDGRGHPDGCFYERSHHLPDRGNVAADLHDVADCADRRHRAPLQSAQAPEDACA